MKNSRSLAATYYHKLLRVGVCVVALVLVFDSGLLAPATAKLSKNTQEYMANAVGVYVGVAPNEVNTLTSRISELEQERDLLLSERAIDVGLARGDSTTPATSTFILSGILFIMLVLIILNYALDYARARERYLAHDNRSPEVA